MKSSLFEFKDYKKLVLHLIQDQPHHGRGKRKEMAESIKCNISHITNVLSGDGHFSQEQAEAVAQFFGFNHDEVQYFLLLVQANRAGTASLKKLYEQMLEEIRAKHLNFAEKTKLPELSSINFEFLYYSKWYYSAIHVLISIPAFQTREAIAQRLMLNLSVIDGALKDLEEMGCCTKSGTRYVPTNTHIHLNEISKMIQNHHSNWRLKLLTRFDPKAPQHFHYSGVMSLSKKDLAKIKDILSQSVLRSLELVAESKEEEAAVMCLDLFTL